MSGANEYPFAGDLTDERISGMLHSTLERLARRTAENNTYITNIYEEGPEDAFSSPVTTSWTKDPDNDVASTSQLTRYNWGCSWGFASGYFWYSATEEPVTKVLGLGAYRRLGLIPLASVARESDQTVACQEQSTEIHNSQVAIFGTADGEEVPINGNIHGIISFQIPLNFKGFKPEGIEIDFRCRGTGMGTSSSPALTLEVDLYKSHCTDLNEVLVEKSEDYAQNATPVGGEPVGSGIADSCQHDTIRFSGQDLGALWRPGDTIRITVQLLHNVVAGMATLALYTGVLKVNYRT